MPLSIIRPGVLDMLQDGGRLGFSKYGINSGGAMDRFAASAANNLVGNAADKAVLEIHFPGPQALLTEDALISVTGADFLPTIDEEPFPLWHPVVVKKNSVLQFQSAKKGARAYLGVHGGLYSEKWLGSYSTNLRAGVGGWKGRKLEKGDDVPIGFHELPLASFIRPGRNFRTLPWSPDIRDIYFPEKEIAFIPGREWSLLTADAIKKIEEQSFTITPQSDRMGYQLAGPPVSLEAPLHCITSPVSFGTMQLLPDNQIIILMADHQTTGGYPKIGHVVSADLPKLAQLLPGDEFRFKKVDLQFAESKTLHMQKALQNLDYLCTSHLNQVLCVK